MRRLVGMEGRRNPLLGVERNRRRWESETNMLTTISRNAIDKLLSRAVGDKNSFDAGMMTEDLVGPPRSPPKNVGMPGIRS